MINEKKLLCAFVYSAYASGYCGLKLDKVVRQEHKEMCRMYISEGNYFPKNELDKTQGVMMSSVQSTSVRDYLYNGHFDVVSGRIEAENGGRSFEEIMVNKGPLFGAAMGCAVQLYRAEAVENNIVKARHLVLPITKELTVLQGLEKPLIGDVVAGHWNYYLETPEERWVDIWRLVAGNYFKRAGIVLNNKKL